MITGALWSIGYAIVLIGAAVWHFLRKDITSDWRLLVRLECSRLGPSSSIVDARASRALPVVGRADRLAPVRLEVGSRPSSLVAA